MDASRRLTVCFLVFVSLVLGAGAQAQTGSMRVTTPSPTAASLGKFGDVPVGLYTGSPDISIPLYTVKGRTLELPITLRYSAGGIKVEEAGGWAGLGWALEAGGTITRTVRGKPDENWFGYLNTGHVWYNSANWPNPSYQTVKDVADGNIDGEPDRFFFSFAGRSGQFVMGPTTTSTAVKEYRAIPHQALKIEPVIDTYEITSFSITTEDGTRYTFGAVERTTDLTMPIGSQIADNYGEQHNSTWHLTEIRSPGGDVITLSYTPATVRHASNGYREKFDQVGAQGPCVQSEVNALNDYEIIVQRLASIQNCAAHGVIYEQSTRGCALADGPAAGSQTRPAHDKNGSGHNHPERPVRLRHVPGQSAATPVCARTSRQWRFAAAVHVHV